MTAAEAGKLRAVEAQKYLVRLIEALDTCDEDDYFGSEGWRHFLMAEDA